MTTARTLQDLRPPKADEAANSARHQSGEPSRHVRHAEGVPSARRPAIEEQ